MALQIRSRCMLFCWMLVTAAWSPVAAYAAEPLEYSVKAAYLTKFGIYVEWPDTAFPAPNSPINLCVIGENHFGSTLGEAAASQRVGNRAIAVQHLKTITPESGCHILYVGNTDPATLKTLEALRGSPVLTVTDSSASGMMGVINFVIKDNRVRFEVDEATAAQNNLVLSSKLLSLALNSKQKR